MVEDVRLDGQDNVQSVPVTTKIRDQDFDLAAGDALANFLNGAGEDAGAAVGLVIAIDAGDDRIAQTHARGSFGDTEGLFFVRWSSGFAGWHSAETACARADIAENHEGRGAVFPAFAHVGAARGFADGMKVQRAHDALEVVVAITAEKFHAQPVWARMDVWGRCGWHVAIGDDVKG